jgi:hypothetical protein
MTNAEVKTAYEANADTNEFSDAEQTKLSGIASGADNVGVGTAGQVLKTKSDLSGTEWGADGGLPSGGTVGQVVTNTAAGAGNWGDAPSFEATDTLLWSGSNTGGSTITLGQSMDNFKFITFYGSSWKAFHTMSVASFKNNKNGDVNGHMLAGYSTDHVYVKWTGNTTIAVISGASLGIARVVGIA